MRAAYIGILTPGSTSRMRAEWLKELTPEWTWEWVDTDPPLETCSRVWRTLAYRFQVGKAVDRINHVVTERMSGVDNDLVWVDKAIFLRKPTMDVLRANTRRLVHFTPDTAFHANRSRNFESTLNSFDLLVTTKSFEVAQYRQRLERDTLLVTTQGYDARVHFPRATDDDRRREAVFIGLAEPERIRCIETLLDRGISVRLGGRGWNAFAKQWQSSPHFAFEGEDVFGGDYARLLSGSWIGLGLLSKRFPELHTTRTFEIPACGAALATEATSETSNFFAGNEAVFFSSFQDLADRITAFLAENDLSALRSTAAAGHRRVLADGRDYESILAAILSDDRITG